MLLHAWIIGRALLWTAVQFHHVQHYVMMAYSKLLSLIFICVCQPRASGLCCGHCSYKDPWIAACPVPRVRRNLCPLAVCHASEK